ncbi:hypothetical protein OHV13_22480 [Kitasatospora purpeofusca]|uniref:hypothetical protein n=1 Tax=Kitasatospora purpeofusca TaxID=67352 RepID=UPI003246B425
MPKHPENLAGGEPMPAPDTSRTELGRCITCRSWAWGYFVVDLTPSIALVQHCTDSEDGADDGPSGPGHDSPQLTAAASVSVAAVVVLCVLLLTIWR